MLPLDLLADLPQPRDDEPSSLRSDIADELADHLQCAFRREVLKDGDREAAQRRALDRFGDPKKLARRLWRQAMWSRMMKQRIVSGLQWMVALTAMLIAGAVFWQQSQMFAELRQARQDEAAQRQALTAKLDQLQLRAGLPVPIAPASEPLSDPATYELSAAPTTLETGFDFNSSPSSPEGPIIDPQGPYHAPQDVERGPPVLTLKFVQETEDGPPVSPASVELVDSANVLHQGERNVQFMKVPLTYQTPDGRIVTTSAERETTIDNKIVFRSLEPDNYQLNVRLAGGEQCQRSVLIRDEKPRELTILCPAPRKKAPVPITIKPLPEKLRQKKFDVSLHVWVAPVELGQARWITPNLPNQLISFDGQTGLATAIDASSSGQHLDLSDLPGDERRVFLPVGTVQYQFRACERLEGPGGVPIYEWPISGHEESSLQHTVEADEAAWELELPQEFVDYIVSQLDSAGAYPAPRAN